MTTTTILTQSRPHTQACTPATTRITVEATSHYIPKTITTHTTTTLTHLRLMKSMAIPSTSRRTTPLAGATNETTIRFYKRTTLMDRIHMRTHLQTRRYKGSNG